MSAPSLNQHVSLDAIIKDYPSLHRKPDGTPWFLGISGATLKVFAGLVEPGMKTIETGAGFSTLAFIHRGTDHTAICPDDYLEKNIRDWCDEKSLNHERFSYIQAKSQDVLPSLQDEFDFAFIDGEHAFPLPMIDFYFLARRLKAGGHLVIDDTHIWTGEVIVQHLMTDADWQFVSDHDGKTAIFKLLVPYRDKGLWNQPFVLANSKGIPATWYDGLKR